jgi:two-component system response regulator DegU
MIKIVIISERIQDRNRLYSILSLQDDFEISAFGKDGYDALKLSAQFRPDIIIIDLGKNNGEGPKLVPLIKRKSPDTEVIFLNSRADHENAALAVSTGALGYVVKDHNMSELVVSVRTVYNGSYFISAGIVTRIFRMLSDMIRYRNVYRTPLSGKKGYKPIPPNINRMELQIMTFIAQGHSNKEIAENLQIKQGTVRNYLSSAMHKAGLTSRTQVVMYAIASGLIHIEGLLPL